jgi:hypothetical protein
MSKLLNLLSAFCSVARGLFSKPDEPDVIRIGKPQYEPGCPEVVVDW